MPAPVPLERFLGGLFGLAVGDALGAPFEGVPADHIFFVAGPIHELLAQTPDETFRYTDDTQMMIGVAEALLEDGEMRAETLARRFAANYEPDRGYGQGARQLVEAMAAGDNWDALAETIFPGGSFGNGAAMRVAPVGLLFAPNLQKVAEQARASALPTHRHPLGIEGAELLALAVALAAEGPPLDRARFYRALLDHCRYEEFRWQLRAARKLRPHQSLAFLGNSLPAHRSVVTSIACFTATPTSFEAVMASAISLGDDTDTLAAMAGALSGAHLGLSAIQPRWGEQVENAAYIRALAERLYARHLALSAP